MDDEGYVNITGRIKDMVIRGGENVYPREIEEFLYTHPDILDAQVIGVPDERYGEELCAWVKLRPGAEPLDRRRRSASSPRDRLAHYKIPRYVLIVDDFPMTVTGKIRKVEMREKSVAALGLGSSRGGHLSPRRDIRPDSDVAQPCWSALAWIASCIHWARPGARSS